MKKRILIVFACAFCLLLLITCNSGQSFEKVGGFKTDEIVSVYLMRGGECVPTHIVKEENCPHVLAYTFEASDPRVASFLKEMKAGIIQEITVGDPEDKFYFMQYIGSYTYDRIWLYTETGKVLDLIISAEEPEYVLIQPLEKDVPNRVATVKSSVITPQFIAETLEQVDKGELISQNEKWQE